MFRMPRPNMYIVFVLPNIRTPFHHVEERISKREMEDHPEKDTASSSPPLNDSITQ